MEWILCSYNIPFMYFYILHNRIVVASGEKNFSCNMALFCFVISKTPRKIEFSDKVIITKIKCGKDGTMFLTDTGTLYACGKYVFDNDYFTVIFYCLVEQRISLSTNFPVHVNEGKLVDKEILCLPLNFPLAYHMH